MFRKPLLELLRSYKPAPFEDASKRTRMMTFIMEQPDCFKRELLIGHITGSAWVLNTMRDKVLLTHHRKLDKWLQLGGHCDGDTNVLGVALREAEEESGIKGITIIAPLVFDIDILPVPARHTQMGIEPEHLHYDVRFCFQASDSIPLEISSESKDLRWVQLNEVHTLSTEESMLRMVRKTAMMR